MNLTDTSVLIPLLQRHNLYSQKQFGQHFLINRQVLDAIVEAADLQPEDQVVEIGVGTGVLTRELAERVRLVKGFEIDRHLEPLLGVTLAGLDNVSMHWGDFLQVDVNSLPQPFKLVANLPYNVGSHIIDRLICSEKPPQSMTVLLQKEVAEKFIAEAPRATYLSNFVQGYGRAKIIMNVPAKDFFPAPKVDSAVLHIRPHDQPLFDGRQMKRFSGFLHKGFSQPRKKLNKVFDGATLEMAGINANWRPQEVEFRQWVDLAKIELKGE